MFWIVNIQTESLMFCFEDQRCQTDSSQIWLEVPQGLVRGNVKVLNTEGVLSLVEDTSKSDTNPYWKALRTARNVRLQASDWTQLSDSPLSPEDKAAWAAYRQDLRDLPADTTDPENPTWPTEPT
jgi:hypothetical protein